MRNTILKFDTKEVILDGESFIVQDYFSKKINVKDFFDSMPDQDSFYKFIKIDTNDKLERLQYHYYENPNYWDIILLINGMDTLALPMQDDVYHNKLDRFMEIFFEGYFNKNSEEIQSLKNRLENEFRDDILNEVEENRYIKIVPESKMPQLISRLNRAGFI